MSCIPPALPHLVIAATCLAAALALSAEALGQRRGKATTAAPKDQATPIEAAVRDSWPEPRAEWRQRLDQDEIQRLCSQYRNRPPRRVAAAIQRLARASIIYPADGFLAGDWRRGETIAQSGYGRRFSDTDTSRPNGGNCYACHRIDRSEQSFGTLGPDLAAYGRLHDFSAAAARRAYDNIYNPHAVTPCSAMPRFGAGRTLTAEQIKDLVALLMARDSPVNR